MLGYCESWITTFKTHSMVRVTELLNFLNSLGVLNTKSEVGKLKNKSGFLPLFHRTFEDGREHNGLKSQIIFINCNLS